MMKTVLPCSRAARGHSSRASQDRKAMGSNPTSAVSKLAISFTPLCQCLLEETLKAVDPFYLVSMPGEVKDSYRG